MCEVKGRVCEVSLGRRGKSSNGEGGRGMRSCCPTTSQILRPPGFGFCLQNWLLSTYRYWLRTTNNDQLSPIPCLEFHQGTKPISHKKLSGWDIELQREQSDLQNQNNVAMYTCKHSEYYRAKNFTLNGRSKESLWISKKYLFIFVH